MTGPGTRLEALHDPEDGVLVLRPETGQTGERQVGIGLATGDPAEILARPEAGRTVPVPGG